MIARYTKADNGVVVPTDTMKQTVYIMAKQHPVNPPELFASILGSHFISEYPWIHAAHIKVVQHRWTRMVLDGEPHPHSFLRDGSDTRNVEVSVTRKDGIDIVSAIAGLLVLKSTGSAFYGFNTDEYTILKPTEDRILSTEVDCEWKWQVFPNVAAVEKSLAAFDQTWTAARDITLKTFANESSPSVQNTMYKMAEQILAVEQGVESVNYSLPNKHYFEVGKCTSSRIGRTRTDARAADLSWHKGLKNTGKDAEVYAPQSDPNGLIKCTVSR